ncbi:MAG: rod shape-determining protein MreC [Candidatus Pacebacteria bacterium]|nr:rod shape-determining protein MreC [Candidatus Paceibacterota bacterium]
MRYINNKINYFPFSILIIVVLIVFEVFGLAGVITSFFSSLTKPLQVISNNLVDKIEAPFILIKKSINSAKKVQMMEYRYSEVLAQLSDIDELRDENRELRKLLENSDRQARTVIISAPVVSHVGPSIGAGSNEGVEVGDLIFVAQTLVGRVSEVNDSYSRVNLAYQKDFEPLVVLTKEGYKGIVKGDGKRVILTEVLPEEMPALESRIVTVGQVGVDQGLFVGQVGKTLSLSSDPIQTFLVTQYVDFYQANVVEIYK